MIDPFTIKSFFKKDIRTICLTLGGYYIIFGVFILLAQKLQASTLNQIPDETFLKSFYILHKIWWTYMPLMIALGVLYLLFGLIVNKVQIYKFHINLTLGILSILWALSYSIACFSNIDVFLAGFGGDFEIFKYIAYLAALFGFAVVLGLFTVPQYIIHKKIISENQSNS